MMDCICGHALNTHVFGCKECRAIGGCSCKTYQIVRSPGPEHERDWQWRWEKLKRFLEQEEAEAEIIRKKPNYTGISLNSHYKKEIVGFIEKHLPEMKGILK